MMKFAEFFAGIGLVRLGLEYAGWTCVYANDISAAKADIYRRNFGENDLTVKDIATVAALELPHFDVATASFPCQDVSLAGKREGLAGRRSSTFHDFRRILTDLHALGREPRGVVIENVPGLLTSHGGQDIDVILGSLASLGYTLDLLIIDAARFVPQSRVRVFIIGLKEANLVEVGGLFAEAALAHELRGQPVRRVVSRNAFLRWGFLDLPLVPRRTTRFLPDIVERMYGGFEGERLDKELSYIRDGSRLKLDRAFARADATQNSVYLTGYRRMRKGLVALELRDDAIAGCLRAVTGGSSKQLLVRVEPNRIVRMRYLTAREYARLQGVPESFWIPEKQVAGLHAFGDAVAVPVLEWLGRAVTSAFVNEPVPA